jgi:hypothetical protein
MLVFAGGGAAALFFSPEPQALRANATIQLETISRGRRMRRVLKRRFID